MATPPDPEGSQAVETDANEVSLKRIQILNLVFVAAGAGLALMFSREMAYGVLLGGVPGVRRKFPDTLLYKAHARTGADGIYASGGTVTIDGQPTGNVIVTFTPEAGGRPSSATTARFSRRTRPMKSSTSARSTR